MQSRVIALLLLGLMAVGYAAGAAPAYSGVKNFIASLAAAASSDGMMARISSAVTEPFGLVLMGVCLIGLSVLVRKRSSRRRTR